MDGKPDWSEGLRKEMDTLLGAVQNAQAKTAAPSDPASSVLNPPLILSLESLEFARLEAALEELQRRLSAKTLEFEAQRKAQERLQSRMRELARRPNENEEEIAFLRREAAASESLAQEFGETLKVATEARAKLSAALDEERQQVDRWISESRTLKAQLDRLLPELAGKEAAAEAARSSEAVLAADLERQKKIRESDKAAWDEERARLQAQADRSLKAAEDIRREGVEALEEARELKTQTHLQASQQRSAFDEEKRRIEAECRSAMQEAVAFKAEMKVKAENEQKAAREALEAERARLYAALDEERAAAAAQPRAAVIPPAAAAPAAPPPQKRFPGHPPEEAPARAAAPAPAAQAAAPERRRRWGLYAAAVWSVAAIAVCLLYPVAGRDHTVPFSHPSALVWQGDSLWVSDWVEQCVFRMTLDGGTLRVVRRYPLPGSHITGMTASGSFLYLADPWQGTIEKRRMDEALTVEKSWPSPGANVSALAHDGRYLYSASVKPGRLYQHASDDTLGVLNAYFAPADVVGIWADQDAIWTADGQSRHILRHRRDQSLSVMGAYTLDEVELGPKAVSSFTRQGPMLWIGRDGSNVLLERPWWLFSSRRTPDVSAVPPAPQPAAP